MNNPNVKPMPEWLERQIDNVEQTVKSWSEEKREASGVISRSIHGISEPQSENENQRS
jgi:hypothetical protein